MQFRPESLTGTARRAAVMAEGANRGERLGGDDDGVKRVAA